MMSIAYGLELRYGAGTRVRDTCADCGVPIGEYHLEFCDQEECPVCHGQLLSCDCADEEGGE
jgi:hypothetical protein